MPHCASRTTCSPTWSQCGSHKVHLAQSRILVGAQHYQWTCTGCNPLWGTSQEHRAQACKWKASALQVISKSLSGVTNVRERQGTPGNLYQVLVSQQNKTHTWAQLAIFGLVCSRVHGRVGLTKRSPKLLGNICAQLAATSTEDKLVMKDY